MNNGRSSSHRHSAVGALYYFSLNEYHSARLQKESASAKKPSGPTIMIDDDGQPVLPDIDFSKGKLLDMKTLLREYLMKCYQNSTGDAKARIPWGQLQQNPGKFIEMMAGFLPEGASLLNPSHIRQGVLIDILCHLKERQDNKDIMVVFEFKSTHRPMLERRSSTVSSSSMSSHTATPGPSQSASPIQPCDPLPVPTSLTPSPSPVPTSHPPSPSPLPTLRSAIPVPIRNSFPTKKRKAKKGSSH